jgi:ATP-dependent DNA ligase
MRRPRPQGDFGRRVRLSCRVGFLRCVARGVCAHELEGVVAKPLRSRYVPGERGWVKTKNRDYWRYEMEREGVLNRRERQFV